MWVFLRFGDSDLFFSFAGKDFPKGFPDIFLVIYHMYALKGVVVIGHRNVIQGQLFHFVFRKILLAQYLGELPPAVCPKIEENHHISLLDGA